jgi:hypothetical protein
MSLKWTHRESWVAVFDVLGFAGLVEGVENEVRLTMLTDQIEELLQVLESDESQHGLLKSIVFSDTIAIFTQTSEPHDYPWFLLQCRNLITKSINLRLPLRGAISVGVSHVAEEHSIVLGKPFLEAFRYCEDQDWIGLLMTPTATRALRNAGLEPRNHDFVDDSVPLRRCQPGTDVLAYRFQNGAANFANPLLRPLSEMMQRAPSEAKGKYERTIAHIKKHYRWIEGDCSGGES